jgi:hypothetical protein
MTAQHHQESRLREKNNVSSRGAVGLRSLRRSVDDNTTTDSVGVETVKKQPDTGTDKRKRAACESHHYVDQVVQ